VVFQRGAAQFGLFLLAIGHDVGHFCLLLIIQYARMDAGVSI
jgi:hypothetical protein